MKVLFALTVFAVISLHSFRLRAQSDKVVTESGKKSTEHLYLDVHHLGPGKVTAEAVAEAHAKDLAVQGKYGVHFLKYWVDEAGGDVYCLSSSADTQSIRKTHADAHGLLPDQIYAVTEGKESAVNGKRISTWTSMNLVLKKLRQKMWQPPIKRIWRLKGNME